MKNFIIVGGACLVGYLINEISSLKGQNENLNSDLINLRKRNRNLIILNENNIS